MIIVIDWQINITLLNTSTYNIILNAIRTSPVIYFASSNRLTAFILILLNLLNACQFLYIGLDMIVSRVSSFIANKNSYGLNFIVNLMIKFLDQSIFVKFNNFEFY